MSTSSVNHWDLTDQVRGTFDEDEEDDAYDLKSKLDDEIPDQYTGEFTYLVIESNDDEDEDGFDGDMDEDEDDAESNDDDADEDDAESMVSSSINSPTELDQTTATMVGNKIVFAWLKRDTQAANPLANATAGHLYSFIQSHPNALPEQQRHQLMNEPDALPLSYYHDEGKIRWVVKGSTVPLTPLMERNCLDFAGVWVPNKIVREQMTNMAMRPEYGSRSRQSLIRERAEDVCEEYSAWRNGDFYWYYIATYNLKRDGQRALDRYEDYKSESALYSYADSRGRIFRWHEALSGVKQALGRVISRLEAAKD